MDDHEREALAEQLIERLRRAGAPEGTWLLEIEQVRGALRSADDILRRMKDAIIDDSNHGPR